jgi:hypothetical protein
MPGTIRAAPTQRAIVATVHHPWPFSRIDRSVSPLKSVSAFAWSSPAPAVDMPE